MSIKASISLTESQHAFARDLVERGRYASLSAVLQRGLEMMREEAEAREAEHAALKALLEDRLKGPFVSLEEGERRSREMLDRERKRLGL